MDERKLALMSAVATGTPRLTAQAALDAEWPDPPAPVPGAVVGSYDETRADDTRETGDIVIAADGVSTTRRPKV